MNTRIRTIFMAVALAAAATAMGSQAAGQPGSADQGDYFGQQRQITDGYYPQYSVVVTPARVRPATQAQAAEDKWLDKERAADSNGSKPVRFSSPTAPSVATLTNTSGD